MTQRQYWLAAMMILLTARFMSAEEAGGTGSVTRASFPTGEMTVPENAWTKIAEVPPDPLGRELEPGRGAFLCHEPVGGKFLRYGGYTPTDCNALWTFDPAARKWENPLKVDYSWPPPTNRPGAGVWWSLAYDESRKAVWCFGGWGVVGRTHPKLMFDVWRYDPSAGSFSAMGSAKAPGCPPSGLPIVYDSRNDLVVAAPIAGKGGELTYVYSPSRNAWEARVTKGMPRRVDFGPQVFVYAPCIGKAVYLENDPAGGAACTWTYDAASNIWARLPVTTNPPGRVVAGAAYDSVNRVVVVHGGVTHGPVRGGGSAGYLHGGNGHQLHDTWALDPSKPEWHRLDVGQPAMPKLPGEIFTRFEINTAMAYDTQHQLLVMAAPTLGVWALRYRPEGAKPLPECRLAAPVPFDPPASPERVYPMLPPNPRLLELPPGKWVELGGGRRIGGNEVMSAYDEGTGFIISYGGCGNEGTTFSTGYGNALSGYDPAAERWMALRWYDPCGPARPHNGCNRFTAYDPVRRVTWMHGGTMQNRLAASHLPDWPGGPHIWHYSGVQDRFGMTPLKAPTPEMGNGMVTAYDRAHNLFVINLGSYWKNVFAFDPEKSVWRKLGERRNMGYSFCCYVESLRGIFALDDGTPVLFDSAKGEWKELESKGTPPPAKRLARNLPEMRSTSAYDSETDTVVSITAGRAWAYDVKTATWRELSAPPSGLGDKSVVYDSRHKVFLYFTHKGVSAYRLPRQGGSEMK